MGNLDNGIVIKSTIFSQTQGNGEFGKLYNTGWNKMT